MSELAREPLSSSLFSQTKKKQTNLGKHMCDHYIPCSCISRLQMKAEVQHNHKGITHHPNTVFGDGQNTQHF